jgi:hypothetical protein
MGQVALLSLTAALNPTLIAASTAMMLLDNPVRLMVGYLIGALTTSVTIGLVILFTLSSSSAVSTTKRTLSPSADIALGALALMLAYVLSTVLPRRRERRMRSPDRGDKKDPRWKRAMSRGSARTMVVIGALLTLPGASYLAGLIQLHKLHLSTFEDVLVVIGFNLVMLALLEVPLACFVVAPEWTPGAIDRAKAAAARNGPRVLVRGLVVIGVLLIVKGVVGLIVG